MKILAVSPAGDGYETDQTVTTPGCLCERDDRLLLRKVNDGRISLTHRVCLPSGQRPTGSVASASTSCDCLGQ